MTKTNLPKNFEKILSAAQQMLGIMQEFSKEGKGNWSQAYEERWFKALEEFTSQIYANKEYENCLSYEDIRERIWNISAETGKSIKEITAGDLRQIVETILGPPKKFDFYFPQMEIFNLPDSYELGHCVLHTFEHLPKEVKDSISSNWELEYEEEKALYYVRNKNEYEEAKKQETYFCLSVSASGREKATEIATIRANQSFNILKCIYVIQDLPRLKRCHWFTEGMSGAVHDYRYKSGWFRHSSNPELEAYVKNLTQLMKGESDDIGRRCLTAIDVYCMIDQETPLQVRFLLSVIATEGLLLGKDDRDFLGWKLREKVAILIGDTTAWFVIYLQKDVRKDGWPSKEECDANRVAARAALAKRVGDMYNKRSKFAHGSAKDKDQVGEEDFRFASMVFRLSMQRLLTLREKGISRIHKED